METIIGGNGANGTGGANGGPSGGGPSGGGPSGGGGPLIKDSDTAGFAADVIEASKERPIVVDFWAEWCGPCKQLGPMLEQAINDANGAVALVKIDVDANQALAGQLRVQSIPTVFAFKDGEPVDAFQGALPESKLKEWLKNLIEKHGGAVASPVDEALGAAAAAREAGNFEAATAIYGQVLSKEAENLTALAGLAQCLIAAGEGDKARELLAGQSEEIQAKQEIQAVLSELDLAAKGQEAAGRLDELQAALAADAGNHQARYELALAYYANGDAERAMNELLEIIAKSVKWNEEAARLQLLQIFDALGPTDPRTIEARRRLSSALFS